MSETLWGLSIPGPDDLWAMPSKEIADQRASEHNEFVRKSGLSAQTGIPEDKLFARVVEWPYSPEDHALALTEQESEDADTEGDGNA